MPRRQQRLMRLQQLAMMRIMTCVANRYIFVCSLVLPCLPSLRFLFARFRAGANSKRATRGCCKLSTAMQALFNKLVGITLSLFERNILPDFLSRRGIRWLLSQRLREILAGDASAVADREQS